MSGDKIRVPKLTAQILFDALVHSINFGSGFLDTEEVDALRDLATILGVDPLTATPEQFVKHYPHPFEPMTDPRMVENVFGLKRPEWRDRSALGMPPGFVIVQQEGGREIDFVPCKAGAYPYCQKPESAPVHASGQQPTASTRSLSDGSP